MKLPRRIGRLISLCVVCLLCTTVVCAVEVSDSHRRERNDDWYEVYLKDSKVGFAHFSYGPSQHSELPGYAARHAFHIQTQSMGEAVSSITTEEFFFHREPPHELYFARLKNNSGTILEVRPGRGGYVADVKTQGQQRRLQLGPAAFSYDDLLLPEQWIRENPDVGASLEVGFFSMSDLRFGRQKLTVADYDPQTGIYRVVAESSSSETKVETFLDDQGHMVSATLGQAMRLKKAPREKARRRGVSKDIFASTASIVDTNLGDPRLLGGLYLEAYGNSAPLLKSGPWQKVTATPDGRVFLTLGEAATPVTATQAEIENALQGSYKYPVDEGVVVTLARKATAGAETRAQKVAALARFVSRYVHDVPHPKETTVFDVIKERKGDCSEHSLLFTALARSVGVPAREVVGLLYQQGAYNVFVGHAWNEVVLDGRWVAVDPSTGESRANGGRVRFGSVVGGGFLLAGADILFRKLEATPRMLPVDVLEEWVSDDYPKDGSVSAALGQALLRAEKYADAVEPLRRAVDAGWGGRAVQLDLASALAKGEWRNEAIELARSVFWKAVDASVRRRASELLDVLGAPPSPITTFPAPQGDVELAIVPVGNIDPQVVSEFAVLYAQAVDAEPTVASAVALPEQPDRLGLDAFVQARYEASRVVMDEDEVVAVAQAVGLSGIPISTEGKQAFLDRLYADKGTGAAVQRLDFQKALSRLAESGQYDARHVAALARKTAEQAELVVAVTDCDLYIPGETLVRGYGGQGTVVVSARRLRGAGNGEPGNRIRLVKEMLAKAVSMTRRAIRQH